MASIRQRGKTWRAEICVDGVRRSASFDTKEEAKRWARHQEATADDGLLIDLSLASKTTLAEAIERFIRERVAGWRRTPTAEHRESAQLRRLAMLPFCQKKLSQLTPQDFTDFRTDRMKEVQPSTVCKDLNAFSLVLKTAMIEWRMRLPFNPCDRTIVRRPKFENERDRILDADEMARLWQALGHCSCPFVLPAAQFSAETGLRLGELLGIHWRDVSLEERTLHVRRVLDQKSGQLRDKPKNGTSRHVPLSSRAVTILTALPREGSSERPFPVSHSLIDSAFGRARNRAKIENFRWHDLRHCAVTLLADYIPVPMDLMSVTGHKTLQQVARYYTAKQAAKLATNLP